MPRRAMVPLRDAIDVVKEFMDHFTTDKLPEYTFKIWEDMSVLLKKRWNAHSIYTNVRENGRFILTIAREEMGIVVSKGGCEHLMKNEGINESSLLDGMEMDNTNSEHDSTFDLLSDMGETNNNKKFELVLSQEDWDAIKPDCRVIAEDRKKPILMPGVWTNIVFIAFWKQHKLNCAFAFKRADIKTIDDGLSYEIMIVGQCTSENCGNKFIGRATKRLSDLGE